MLASSTVLSGIDFNAALQPLQYFADQHSATFGVERSLKIERQAVFDQRFLLTFAKDDFAGDAYLVLKPLLLALSFPASLHLRLRHDLQRATIIHLAYECGVDNTVTYKVYCEFADDVYRHLATGRLDAVAVHCAYKWQADCFNQFQISDYRMLPRLSREQLQREVDRYALHLPWLAALLDVACQRVPAEQLFFLTVSDRDSLRQSFALTLYDADIALSQLDCLSLSPTDSLGVDRGQWQRILNNYGDQQLGNIAVGLSRNDQLFTTLYFKDFEKM
jgi:hypothetical protein